jgi:surface antigen
VRPASTVLAACLCAALATAAGAQSGHPLYPALDDADRANAGGAVQEALERYLSGESLAWRGVLPGVSGSVTPQRTFRIASGHYCREFAEAIALPNRAEIRVLTACRDSGGRWILVEPVR